MQLATSNLSLLKATDQCVMCGMCLPHCPTYLKTQDEGESPRGRISLMQGLLSGKLELTPRLAAHFDHCLACRACEAVCPSGVRYGTLIDGTRATIASQRPRPAAREPLLNRLVLSKSRLRMAGRLLRLYQVSGLRWLAQRSGLLRALGMHTMDALLPRLLPQHPWQMFYPAHGQSRGEVALFTGCIAEIVDRPALDASVKLLPLLGYGVHIPQDQTCCGALHLHHGDVKLADKLAGQNRAAFGQHKLHAIITVASACGVTLAEYGGAQRPTETLAAPVMDISQFLAGIDWPKDISVSPLAQRVAVHDPCSLTHVLRQQDKPYALLSRIPGIELVPLTDNARCCGGAGSYMLEQPAMAESLRDDKIAALRATGANILVTSNVGCALHLRAGIQAANLNIEVMHPVALLARQIKGQREEWRKLKG